MKTPTGLNLGRQGVDKSTEPTFDNQQARDNMDIDDNDRFKKLEEDSLPGNKQGQNQEADQLVPTSAAGQTIGQTTQPLFTDAAKQVSDQVRPLSKTL